jgi:hypothetical protein
MNRRERQIQNARFARALAWLAREFIRDLRASLWSIR